MHSDPVPSCERPDNSRRSLQAAAFRPVRSCIGAVWETVGGAAGIGTLLTPSVPDLGSELANAGTVDQGTGTRPAGRGSARGVPAVVHRAANMLRLWLVARADFW